MEMVAGDELQQLAHKIFQMSEKEAYDEVGSRFGHLDPDGKSVDEIWTHYREKLSLWKQKRPLFKKFLKNWNKAGGPKDQISRKLASAEKIIQALRELHRTP